MRNEVGGKRYEDIRERTLRFSINVIDFCKSLSRDEINRVLVTQLIRSATSIGANLEEAIGSRTRPEFINSTNIAKKEARETYYWLKLLNEISAAEAKMKIAELMLEINEIIAILTSSVRKLEVRSMK